MEVLVYKIMNPMLKAFLIVSCAIAIIAAIVFLDDLFERCVAIFSSTLYEFFLAQTASKTLAVLGVIAVLIAIPFACYLIHKVSAAFTAKITSSYQSFTNTNLSNSDSIFREIYNDPTISLKDKILFFAIYTIYCIQRPFLYCASKISLANQLLLYATLHSAERLLLGFHIALTLVNAIILAPVALLELIKYPLVKLFSPLGLNVRQLSFLFNTGNVGSGSQSVHTSDFERSVIRCAQELKVKYGTQPNVLEKEFEDYINNSEELNDQEKNLLKNYLNFNNSNRQNWTESQTKMTLTQAANLVLTAARGQKLDMTLLKDVLRIRLQEGIDMCYLGMFVRIVYSLSCLETINNFIAEADSQIYEKMPEITKQFLLGCNNKKIRFLKDNFDNFYFGEDMNSQVEDNINKLMADAKQYVFNKLYMDYYNRYGKGDEGIGRGAIKHKLKESITDEDIKEAVNAAIDEIEIPPTYFERVKTFFCGAEHTNQPGC